MNFLFNNFLKDDHTYLTNVEYWQKQFKKLLAGIEFEKYFNTTYANGEDFLDGNPIFNFKLNNSERAVFIIQEEPESDDVCFNAWIDKFESDVETVVKLAIVLELSEQSLDLTIDLVNKWILEHKDAEELDGYIKSLIGKIPNKTGKNIFSDIFNLDDIQKTVFQQINPSVPEWKKPFQENNIKLQDFLAA